MCWDSLYQFHQLYRRNFCCIYLSLYICLWGVEHKKFFYYVYFKHMVSQTGKGWKRPYRSSSSNPHAVGRDTIHFTRFLKAPSNMTLNTSSKGVSTTSLGNLFQCLTTLRVKNFNLIPNLMFLFTFFIRAQTTHNQTIWFFPVPVKSGLVPITMNNFESEINLRFYSLWDLKVTFLV